MIPIGTACSGIGGAEVALGLAGVEYRSAWAIENAPHQAEVLRRRFGMRVLDDVFTSGRDNLEPVDLFVAGFPNPALNRGSRDQSPHALFGAILGQF